MTSAIAINTNTPYSQQATGNIFHFISLHTSGAEALPGTEALEVPATNTLEVLASSALEATVYENFLRMTFPNAWNLAEDDVMPKVIGKEGGAKGGAKGSSVG